MTSLVEELEDMADPTIGGRDWPAGYARNRAQTHMLALATRRKVVELFTKHRNATAVAKELGVSRVTVARHLKRAAVR